MKVIAGSAIRRVVADEVIWSFCFVRSPAALFEAGNYFICEACVWRCVKLFAD
jgi:hypothetical protein